MTQPIIYIAGASSDLPRAKDAMAGCRVAGWKIAHDWVADVEHEQSKGNSDAALTHRERVHYAMQDLEAVVSADVFWLLVPEVKTCGAWVELGAALSRRREQTLQNLKPPTRLTPPMTIICSGKLSSDLLFCALADALFMTDEQAFEYINGPVRQSLGRTNVDVHNSDG